MSYAVEFTPGAEVDLLRLHEFLLAGAETLEELDVADKAVQVIRPVALSHLSTTPYSYRKVGARSTLRELIIPSGATGYILRFDIRSPELVLVIGARHSAWKTFIEPAGPPAGTHRAGRAVRVDLGRSSMQRRLAWLCVSEGMCRPSAVVHRCRLAGILSRRDFRDSPCRLAASPETLPATSTRPESALRAGCQNTRRRSASHLSMRMTTRSVTPTFCGNR